MKNRAELSVDIDSVVRKYVPEWEVVSKPESKIHRAIGKFFGFLRWVSWGKVDVAYMKYFWTTLGFTAACPAGDEDGWLARPHEGKHAQQAKKWTRFFFGYLYLFPQSFLPLVFVALALMFSPWFWLGTATLLLPLPAPWRAWWELQAYEISVMVETWRRGDSGYVDRYIEGIVQEIFGGGTYFFMMPIFKGWIRRRLQAAKKNALNWENEINRDPYIDDIYNVLKAGGRIYKDRT